MALTSLFFPTFCLIVLLAFRAIGSSSGKLLVLLVANIVFVASYLSTWTEAWGLLAFAISGYLCTCAVGRWPRTAAVAFSTISIVGLFIVLKYVARGSPLLGLPLFSVIGLSYVLFRVLHVLIDVAQGEIVGRPGLLAYLSYLFYFPAFLSGPVNRYDDFLDGIHRPRPLADEEKVGIVLRILTGLTKVMLVAPVFDVVFRYFSKKVIGGAPTSTIYLPLDLESLAPAGWSMSLSSIVAATAIFYTIYLYANFSGYTDIVVSVSAIFGIHLPENFNRPFAARNVSEFWSRWHMSLSEWFKTYVFTPLVLFISTVVPDRRFATASACFCLFVSFLLIGIWHGSTLVFVYYGLYLGLMAAAHKLFQATLLKQLTKYYKRLPQNPAYVYLCRGLTTTYFAIALVCFWLDASQLATLLRQLGAAGSAWTVVELTICSGLSLALFDAARAGFVHVLPSDASTLDGLRQFKIASLCLVVLFIGVLFNSAPSFVYQGF